MASVKQCHYMVPLLWARQHDDLRKLNLDGWMGQVSSDHSEWKQSSRILLVPE